MNSSANREQAQRCIELAKESVRDLRFERALRYCEKALGMCPEEAEAARLLTEVKAVIASGRAPVVSSAPEPRPRAAPPAAAPPPSMPTPPSRPPPPPPPPSPSSPPPPQQHEPRSMPEGCPARPLKPVYRLLERAGIVPRFRTPILAVWMLALAVYLFRSVIGWEDSSPVSPIRARREADVRGWGGDISYVGEGISMFLLSFIVPLSQIILFPLLANWIFGMLR
eukprot:TRINITY_DN33139_c0_g1_i1.p1 TRINITY_DN33139_c0_g1~~TRINITY_DN33139_c0_g1_i1.p1  ORF type:complete len:225 (+),score=48.82 TRINITY_DN33139_c0_g1_i1:59-733(+)